MKKRWNNRLEWVRKCEQYKLRLNLIYKSSAIREGINDIISLRSFSLLSNGDELEHFVCGKKEFNVSLLKGISRFLSFFIFHYYYYYYYYYYYFYSLLSY